MMNMVATYRVVFCLRGLQALESQQQHQPQSAVLAKRQWEMLLMLGTPGENSVPHSTLSIAD